MISYRRDLDVEGVMQGITRTAPERGEFLLLEEFTYEPGVSVRGHTHGAEQFGYIVSGELEMTISGETGRLGMGDFYHIPAGTTHSLVPSTRVVSILMTALAEGSRAHH